MRTILGSLRATLVVALGALAVPGVAAAQDPAAHADATQRIVRQEGLVAVPSDAPEGLRAKRRDLEAHQDSYDAGDHVKLSFPTAVAATPGGPPLDGIGVEADALHSVDTDGVALATVRTSDAPEFGFDVSVQAARPFFPDGIDNARPFGFDVSMQMSHDQLSGGWHDPGDHVKFGFPRVVSAGAYEDELVWGAIWI
jgi:hypothetical protein